MYSHCTCTCTSCSINNNIFFQGVVGGSHLTLLPSSHWLIHENLPATVTIQHHMQSVSHAILLSTCSNRDIFISIIPCSYLQSVASQRWREGEGDFGCQDFRASFSSQIINKALANPKSDYVLCMSPQQLFIMIYYLCLYNMSTIQDSDGSSSFQDQRPLIQVSDSSLNIAVYMICPVCHQSVHRPEFKVHIKQCLHEVTQLLLDV